MYLARVCKLVWVGIAQTLYQLSTGWTVRDRIPVGDEIFRTRPGGPGTHPPSYRVGTGFFLRVKRPGRGVDHPPPPKYRGQERVPLSSSGPSWPVMGAPLPLP